MIEMTPPAAPTLPATIREMARVMVGPVPVADGETGEVVEHCRRLLRSKTGARIATANLDFIAQSQRDGELLRDLQDSHLVVADGTPVVMLARLAGARRIQRTTGVDLATTLCRLADSEVPLRIVLYGSDPSTAERAARAIADLSPDAEVVLRIQPPYRPISAAEMDIERAAIVDVKPNLILVALGCPRQERLIRDYFECAPDALWIGVGGAFEMIGGLRRRASPRAQQMGLEWIVRLAQDPRRLAGRYFGRDLPALPALCVSAFLRRLGRPESPFV